MKIKKDIRLICLGGRFQNRLTTVEIEQFKQELLQRIEKENADLVGEIEISSFILANELYTDIIANAYLRNSNIKPISS